MSTRQLVSTTSVMEKQEFKFNRCYIHVRSVTKPHKYFAALLISNFEISIVKEEGQNVLERLLWDVNGMLH